MVKKIISEEKFEKRDYSSTNSPMIENPPTSTFTIINKENESDEKSDSK